MRKLAIVSLMIGSHVETVSARECAGSTITHAQPPQYFADLVRPCQTNNPGNRLRGTKLCGLLLLVDAATRSLTCNMADVVGRLVPRDGLHVGTLCPDQTRLGRIGIPSLAKSVR